MSLFSKSAYVWLASVMRDELYITTDKSIIRTTDKPIIKITQRTMILNIADALEKENPNGFDKNRFLENIFNLQHP